MFKTKRLDALWRWARKNNARSIDRSGEVDILTQEAISWYDCIDAVVLCNLDNLVTVSSQ